MARGGADDSIDEESEMEKTKETELCEEIEEVPERILVAKNSASEQMVADFSKCH